MLTEQTMGVSISIRVIIIIVSQITVWAKSGAASAHVLLHVEIKYGEQICCGFGTRKNCVGVRTALLEMHTVVVSGYNYCHALF